MVSLLDWQGTCLMLSLLSPALPGPFLLSCCSCLPPVCACVWHHSIPGAAPMFSWHLLNSMPLLIAQNSRSQCYLDPSARHLILLRSQQHLPVSYHQQIYWGCIPLLHPDHWQKCWTGLAQNRALGDAASDWPPAGCSPIHLKAFEICCLASSTPSMVCACPVSVGQFVPHGIRLDSNKCLCKIQKKIHLPSSLHPLNRWSYTLSN